MIACMIRYEIDASQRSGQNGSGRGRPYRRHRDPDAAGAVAGLAVRSLELVAAGVDGAGARRADRRGGRYTGGGARRLTSEPNRAVHQDRTGEGQRATPPANQVAVLMSDVLGKQVKAAKRSLGKPANS